MATRTDRSETVDFTDDEEATLRLAIDVFRTHGFVGASVQRLVTATGRSRSSLYNRFGDKDGLFVESLRFYLQSMHPTGEGLSTVDQLRSSVDALDTGGELLPCLLARSCAELPDLPNQATPMVMAALEAQWNAMIDSPTNNGDESKGTLALALRHGLAALGAAGVPIDVLNDAIDTLN